MNLTCRSASSSSAARRTTAPNPFLCWANVVPGRAGEQGLRSDPILSHLAERGIRAVIPARSMRKVQRDFDRTLYRQRNRIERTFAHLKEFRRLVTRFDKLKRSV